MISVFTPLLKSVRSSIAMPLPLHPPVQTLFPFLISYSESLVPILPYSTGGSSKSTESAFESTPGSSAAMVYT
jgi:hypothetical protein